MKKIITILSVLTLIFLFYAFRIIHKKASPAEPLQQRNGTAIIMTGAAARIPQEAALLEQLYERKLLNNVVFISGVSSGSLNSLALNGILSGRMTWEEYRKILFGIRNNNIFIQEGRRLPVNTGPERELLTNIAEKKLGFYSIGDLPFMTAITVTDLKDLDLKKRLYRLCSRKINEETDTTLSIVDILMASTSFPIAFPEVKIRNVKTIPDVGYVDGGVGNDHVPFHALLEFEKTRGIGVERVYIISRKSDTIPALSEELRVLGLNDRNILDRFGFNLDNIMKKGFIKGLKAYVNEAPHLVPVTYIWIPDFEQDFLMFNFDKLEDQYNLTTKWAITHDPVPIEEFLEPYYRGKNAE